MRIKIWYTMWVPCLKFLSGFTMFMASLISHNLPGLLSPLTVVPTFFLFQIFLSALIVACFFWHQGRCLWCSSAWYLSPLLIRIPLLNLQSSTEHCFKEFWFLFQPYPKTRLGHYYMSSSFSFFLKAVITNTIRKYVFK